MKIFAKYSLTSLVLCVLSVQTVTAQKNKTKLGIIADVIKLDSFLYSVGYRYVEEGVSRSFSPREVTEEQFKEKLAAFKKAKLKIHAANVFVPSQVRLNGPELSEPVVLGYVDTVMRRAKAAGLRVIVLGSSGARNIPDGYDREKAKAEFVDIVRKMAGVAKKYGIVIAMENLNKSECNFVNSLAEGLEIAKEVDHPNFRLTADIYHMLRENDPPDAIRAAGKYLVHGHIAENKDRARPGKNGEDFRPYFQALKDIGFKGVVTMECRWTDIRQEAAEALVYLQGQLDEVYGESKK